MYKGSEFFVVGSLIIHSHAYSITEAAEEEVLIKIAVQTITFTLTHGVTCSLDVKEMIIRERNYLRG